MRRAIDDWFTVVDARGRLAWLIGLVFAAIVSAMEIIGAAIVAAVLQLATTTDADQVSLPLIGDIERWLPGSTRAGDLRWLAALGACFFIVRGFSLIGQQYFTFRATFSLASRLADTLTRGLLARPYLQHLGSNSSELSTTSVIITQTFATSVFAPVQSVGAQLLVITALAGVALVVEPVGALGAVVLIGTSFAVMLRVTKRRLIRLGQMELEETIQAQRIVSEAFQAIREIKVLGLSEAVRSRVWASRLRWAKSVRTRATIVAAPRSVIETVAFCTLMIVLATRGGGTSEPLAGIGVLGYAVIRILPTANNLLAHVNTARGGQASMQQLAKVLRTIDSQDRPPESVAQTSAPKRPGHLVAAGVAFSYPDGSEVLRDVDVEIPSGSSIGLVGRTGCGKSTLLDILIGLLPPTRGSVCVDQRPLHDNIDSWWRNIGVVPQHITLLDTSVIENIAVGVDPEAIDHEAVDRALSISRLSDVVAQLPRGLETQVGERGVRLSGGQRQRLAIARALYRDPSVVFLDEGTSALDGYTEAAVIEGLREARADRTLVMVAHRVSTLRDCDEILVLDSGTVVARGTHAELLRSSDLFRTLASAGPTK